MARTHDYTPEDRRQDRTRTYEARLESIHRRHVRRDKYAATPTLTKGVAL